MTFLGKIINKFLSYWGVIVFKNNIRDFYKTAVAQKEFNSDFWNEVREISTEGELKAFIEEKVQPVAKKMGYNFSTKELLNYEKQMAIRITEQQLDAVSGGVSAKNWALGGMFSLMALGAGIVGTTNSASAELTTQDVAKSTEVMRAIIDVNIQASKSRNGDWLYLVTDSNSTEALNLTCSMLDSFLKEAGFNNLSEIQAIQAKNAQGQILDIKLDKDLGKLFSESKEILGKLWGTWGKANAKKIKATKSMYGGWLYLTTDSNSTETLNLTYSMLESFLKEAGFNSIYEIQAIQAKNAQGKILDVKLDKDLEKLFSESKEIPGKLWGTWGKANAKKEIPDIDAEQTVAETPGSGAEQSTTVGSALKTEKVASDISDLETTKAATDVDPKEVFETRQLLTDDQQLYAYEALNLQEAYALLKSGVVENVRFYGNIMEIETVNSIRRYTSDKGDAFTELLYMLYPSPAGDLNTNTGFTGRDSFAMYGGMSPELVAKLFAILNDCRNKKIEIPEEFENITLKKEFVRNNLSYVNPKLKNALAWLKAKGLLTAEGFEKVKAIEDAINSAEKLKSNVDSTDIKKLSDKSKYINVALKYEGNIVTYFDGEIKKLEKRNDHETIEIIKELTQLNKEGLKNESENIDKKKKSYNVDFIELNKQAKSIENSPISKKTKFLMHFINTMKKAAELEVTDGSSYPKYFTEHILMSYMCQTLNGSEDVRELYREIAEQLSQNETNKTSTQKEKKAAIAEKIAAKKEEIAKLNDMINLAETQELSPYKSATQSNRTAYQIDQIGEDGNVQIQKDTFSDCADITTRHVINLLTFANEKNWDLILKDANMEDLNTKLKEVVDAIGSKSQVKFYDLKTRLQMFFLYQRGFIENVDEEKCRGYKSKNGADDVTSLARTLWEYVICNMNKENLEKGSDKNKGLYPIVYTEIGVNHELKSGYINMLKLMWNMASALNLKSEALESAKSKIDVLSGLEEYNAVVFEDALKSIFPLFYTGGEIEFTLSDCKYENNEITGDIMVDITKDDQKLNFTIMHDVSHGAIKHNPINLNFYKYLEKYCQNDKQMLNILKKLEDDQFTSLSVEEKYSLRKIIMELNKCLDNNFEKLLLRSFINDPFIQEKITHPAGFYGTFSEEELTLEYAFRNTDLYKRYKALSAYEALQGEENNLDRIDQVVDIDTIKGAKKIVVRQIIIGEDSKQQISGKNLCDILYEKYLEPHKGAKKFSNIDHCICFHDFGEVKEIYNERGEKQENISFDIIKTSEEGKVALFIKNIPENGELIIPSTVYDKSGKEYKVTQFDRYGDVVSFETLKTIKFTGNFENLNFSSFIFTDTKNLQSVEINGNVVNLTIDGYAFYRCNTLEAFVVQGDVKNLNINDYAFYRCYALKTFVVKGNVKNLNIDNYAFYHCKCFKNICSTRKC